jgi:hypothetical protein
MNHLLGVRGDKAARNRQVPPTCPFAPPSARDGSLRAMDRFTRTTRHLHDLRFRDPDDSPPLIASQARDPTFVPRLSWRSTPKVDFSWERIAAGIAGSGVVVFADTSLFDNVTPPEFWDALNDPARLVLTAGVRRELRPWMERGPHHPVVPLLRRKQDAPQDSTVVQLRESDAFAYYWTLLAARRQAFNLYARALAEELGRDPSKSEVRRRVQQAVGERGYLLGKKGLTPRPGSPAGADDEVVSLATMFALTTGRPTMILTKDEDLQEQFYKLIWLLDTHYRATLFADLYAVAPSSFEHLGRVRDTPWVTDRFESLALVRKPAAPDRRVLPTSCHFVAVTCLVLGSQLTEMTFGAETEMQQVLEAKSITGGLNTEKLDGANVHYWLAPIPLPMELHDCVGLAIDRRGSPLAGTNIRIPAFDVDQALFVGERHATYRT